MFDALDVSTFLIYTIGVGVLTWWIIKCYMPSSASQDAATNDFAAGQSLPWFVVAGSLMLTNLSTEQLVGLNGTVFSDGCLSGIFWETFAGLSMIILAKVLLPRYMRLGLITTTGFLGERYDLQTRTIVSGFFLGFYTFGFCPIVLYTGSLAFRSIFELEDVPLFWFCLVIGSIGAVYALFGGLKAVAVSDCLNGIGLVLVGLWVPIAALQKLGGLSVLFEEENFLKPFVQNSAVYDAENAARSQAPPQVPWHAVLTGMMIIQNYYWSTNQVIVQRVLAAKTLAHGQKGVLFAAAMKVVGFTMLCLPGLIGVVMQERGIELNGEPFVLDKADKVYPKMVRAVMPGWSLGGFAGVLLGSVLSTFNSALNSASTIFGLEIYKIYIRPSASDKEVIRVATGFGVLCTVLSFVIAPCLEQVDGIYSLLQKVQAWIALPIVLVFYVGMLTSLPDALAAKVGFCVSGALYLAYYIVLAAAPSGAWIHEVHYLHVVLTGFVLGAVSMALVTYLPIVRRVLCREEPQPHQIKAPSTNLDITPWRYVSHVSVGICVSIALLILSLQIGSIEVFLAFWILWLVGLLCLLWLPVAATAAAAAAEPAEAEPEGNSEKPAEEQAAKPEPALAASLEEATAGKVEL